MSRIQSVLFDKKHWNINGAMTWLEEHNITPIKVGETFAYYYRIRIRDPKKFDYFRVKSIPKRNLRLVIGFKYPKFMEI